MLYKPVTYHGITSKIFCNLKEYLEQYKIYIPEGKQGYLSGQGFAGTYKWCEEAQTLTIEIESKPWFLPYELIIQKMSEAVRNFKCHNSFHTSS